MNPDIVMPALDCTVQLPPGSVLKFKFTEQEPMVEYVIDRVSFVLPRRAVMRFEDSFLAKQLGTPDAERVNENLHRVVLRDFVFSDVTSFGYLVIGSSSTRSMGNGQTGTPRFPLYPLGSKPEDDGATPSNKRS